MIVLGVGMPRKALDTSLVRPELAYIDRVEVGSFTVVGGRMANHKYPGVSNTMSATGPPVVSKNKFTPSGQASANWLGKFGAVWAMPIKFSTG